MADRHDAAPNSEVTGVVTPESQNATSTVPQQLSRLSNGTGGNQSEANKIVRGSSC